MTPLKFFVWLNVASLWFWLTGWVGYLLAKRVGLWDCG